mgnify:FL=1
MIRVIDSHTGGEPTRVIIEGGPDLGSGPLLERARLLEDNYLEFCRSVLCEPRGYDAMVGALIVAPVDKQCVTGVIFFNTSKNLGMCGHATLGLLVTLYHLGQISVGVHKIETPVGIVSAQLHDSNSASVVNVESYRYKKDIPVQVKKFGKITGDIAWGGNWFFLVQNSPISVQTQNISKLINLSSAITRALELQKITAPNGEPIDHVELYGKPDNQKAHSKNFVLCSSGDYDRSPCGTGSSAKLACLAEDGLWPENKEWVQESIIGSLYSTRYKWGDGYQIIPTITGSAFITSEATLRFNLLDPYRHGISF